MKMIDGKLADAKSSNNFNSKDKMKHRENG